MKILKMNQKASYILTCIVLAIFLCGCKERESAVTLLGGLPESTYLTEIKNSLENNKPVVVGFLAEWCPHCRAYKPTFFEVKDSYPDKVTFVHIDVDDKNGSALSSRFQVKGIPTTAFVRSDGSVFKVNVGGLSKEDLIKVVDDLIKSKKKKKRDPIAPFPIEPQEVKPLPSPSPTATPTEGRPEGGRPPEANVDDKKPEASQEMADEEKEEKEEK